MLSYLDMLDFATGMADSCCRRQRFSATNEALDLKNSASALAAHRNTNPSTPCSNHQRESFTPDMIGRKRQIAFLHPTGLRLTR
jgi:hypothetical protein